ncbi:Uncharacterised protein [Bordetella pertussis]|nr:Uncharacterised protein [Bordetella pertussis]CFL89495.1 Uncharacterised protein [Bordetella pertussis]CFM37698.1 Uncharacterised protein [Bordetella pertussis]CFM81051.1 Uncharacterised protein [Bordetella pertussis]CFN28266.1 Uncharacterised protein [Bordetella pertussis]
MRHRRAGQPGADHQHRRAVIIGRIVGCRHPRQALAQRHVPLAAKARRAPDGKARLLQRLPHLPGAAPGGQRGVRRCQPRQGLQHVRVPHGGIAARREAVQEVGVDARRQARRQLLRRAEAQRQGQRAAFELQPVQPGQQRGPLHGQLGGQRLQSRRRMGAQHGQQILARKRVSLQRQHVQAARPRRIVTPGLPQGEKIQPHAKARLADGKARPAAPTLRQAVAPQENMLRLAGRVVARVIDIAIGGAVQAALFVMDDDGGLQGRIRGRHGGRKDPTIQRFATIKPSPAVG